VVLYFYPADFSPVCTAQACAIRDRHESLDAAGVQVFGVSPQGSTSHTRFAERHGLPFALLSDPDRQAIRAFGVQGPFGFGVRRATFLIDRERVIRARAVADLTLGGHLDLIRSVLETEENTRP
jgi:peroxiredoxin Q/BCP